jgi:hypothetical protein
MVTPLARRPKSVRRTFTECANRFELNQALRLFSRAGLPVRALAGPTAAGGAGEVVAVRLGRGRQQSEVIVAGSALPPTVRAEGADAVNEFVRARHAAWVATHPALSAELETPAADTPFAQQLRAIAAVDFGGWGHEFAAFAAGAFRRGSAPDLEAACSEYFGVPVQLDAESVTIARLRVGPLTFAEYLEFHPDEGGSALAALLALAGVFLGPAAAPDVLLIVRADEVPACLPGTDGAIVGLACWPHEGGRSRDADVEYLIRNDSLRGEDQP